MVIGDSVGVGPCVPVPMVQNGLEIENSQSNTTWCSDSYLAGY